MYRSEFFQILVSAEHSFHQNTLMEAIVVEPRYHTTQKTEINTYGPQLVTPICLITVCATALFLFRSNFIKFPRNSKVAIYSFQQVPCTKCQFFNNNQHLRCAVHPSIVSTKQALNCPDYCQKSSKNATETIDNND
ncbi:MAG: hypothetical protein PUP93_08530 [Rhizonema sp. NSF051]|nr:hypothetical protein [Rhizonema sp. NSF051]